MLGAKTIEVKLIFYNYSECYAVSRYMPGVEVIDENLIDRILITKSSDKFINLFLYMRGGYSHQITASCDYMIVREADDGGEV